MRELDRQERRAAVEAHGHHHSGPLVLLGGVHEGHQAGRVARVQAGGAHVERRALAQRQPHEPHAHARAGQRGVAPVRHVPETDGQREALERLLGYRDPLVERQPERSHAQHAPLEGYRPGREVDPGAGALDGVGRRDHADAGRQPRLLHAQPVAHQRCRRPRHREGDAVQREPHQVHLTGEQVQLDALGAARVVGALDGGLLQH